MLKYIVISSGIVSTILILFVVCSDPIKPDFFFTLDLEVQGKGSLIANPQKVEYGEKDTVEIKAIPESGYRFCLWSGDIDERDSMQTPITVIMNRNRKITASFVSEDSCIILYPGTDLNRKIKEIAETEPVYRCLWPQPGIYSEGKAKGKVKGNLKIIIKNRNNE